MAWGRALLGAWLVAVAACGGGPVVEIAEWQLEVAGTARGQVSLPAHVDDLPDESTRYRLTTAVEVPAAWPQGTPLTLVLPALQARAGLWANGSEAVALDESATNRYRAPGWHAWRLPPSIEPGQTVALILEVDHEWGMSGWIDAPARLSPTAAGDARYLGLVGFHRAAEIASVTCIVLVLLMSLVAFILDRSQKAHGWFALVAGLVVWPVLWVYGRTQALFGAYDIAVSLAALNGSWLALVWFIHAQFGARPPSRRWLIPGFITLLAALVAIDRFRGPPIAALASAAILWLPASIHILRFHLHQARRGSFAARRMARVLLVLWCLAMMTTWVEMATPLGVGHWFGGIHPGGVGLALFAVVESLTLGHERLRSLRQSEHLNRELEQRAAEIEGRARELERMADELRRQAETSDRDVTRAVAGLAQGGEPGARQLDAGTRIENRYRVVRPVGAGGMGAVYEVERLSDGARLALKILGSAPTPADLARFAREAELSARLSHRNLVAIEDVDVTGDGDLFLVMELVDGPSLDGARDRYGDLAWARRVIGEVARGLAEMHARGVVHRDLKPANILLAGDPHAPCAKIADLGIARAQGAIVDDGAMAAADTESLADAVEQWSLTQTGAIFGTPLYMAPELAAGVRDARPAADVFGLGIIAFELCTGVKPFAEPPLLARMRGKALGEPMGLDAVGLDAAEVDLVMRALSFDPDVRPSAEEIANAFG